MIPIELFNAFEISELENRLRRLAPLAPASASYAEFAFKRSAVAISITVPYRHILLSAVAI